MTTTVNKIPVIEGYISVPRLGAWMADLTISTTNVKSVPKQDDAVDVNIDGHILAGTVLSAALNITGFCFLRIIAGNGGLAKTLPAESYGPNPQASVILSGMLAAVGEQTYSPLSSQDALNTFLGTWTTANDVTLAANLTRLATAVNTSWRCDLSTGAVIFADDDFNAIEIPSNATVVDAGYSGGLRYEAPIIDKMPLPGTIDGDISGDGIDDAINEVVFFIESTHTEFEFRTFQMSDYIPKFHDTELTSIYTCTVQGQNVDGTYDVIADDLRIKATKISGVSIAGGGSTTWNLQAGAKVKLAFISGDVSQPVIVAIDGFNVGDYLSNVVFGTPSTAQYLAKSDILDSFIDVVINKWVPVPNDGGLALQTALKAWVLSSLYTTTACRRIKSD